jgi:uncharacterized protein (TIGR04222 family)
MNIFDLRGPEFLVVYVMLMGVAAGMLYVSRLLFENSNSPERPVTDPYSIAYLRGGSAEAIKVACAALLERDVLEADTTGRLTVKEGALRPRHPLEQMIVRLCAGGTSGSALPWSPSAQEEAEKLRPELERQGLVPGSSDMTLRVLTRFCIADVLGLVALTKIFIALQRGKTNIGFLVLLGIASVIAPFLYRPRTTPAGAVMLCDLKVLFARLKHKVSRSEPFSGANDFAFLIAVFGISAAPLSLFPSLRVLLPPPSSRSSGNSCGSSCSSSSSCGSSCGGGGGCGGCGS